MDNMDAIFDEDYGSLTDGEDEESEDEEIDEERNAPYPTLLDADDSCLDISKDQAKLNYEAAGTLVEEAGEIITISKYSYLIDNSSDDILNSVVTDVGLSYQLAEFQRVAINALASQKSVVLVSPTGSGKLTVPLLAALVLRKVLGVPKGVCIVTQPLTNIMNEKLRNNICKAAVLSMTGDLRTSHDSYGEEEEATLSCRLQDLLEGHFPVLFAHPESFDSKMGQHILKEMQKRGMLILVCLDEFHQGGDGHWKSFRPSMISSSASTRNGF